MKINQYHFLFLFALTICADAQAEKRHKQKKGGDEPKLSIVQVADKPPEVPKPVPVKPENGSLFTDGAVPLSLVRDFKARQVGDLVFIDVVETNTATVSSNASRDRDSGDLAGLGPLISGLPINGAAVAGAVATDMGQRKFDGKGTTGRTSNVRARIVARVTEVLPNGDMKVEATKLVKINKETEQLAVTGLVRSNDLASDNSVSTTMVGDLKVEFNGKGIASADNAPGWLFRLFDKLSPF